MALDVPALASLLDHLDRQLNRGGEGVPDLLVVVAEGDLMEMLDDPNLAGRGGTREGGMRR